MKKTFRVISIKVFMLLIWQEEELEDDSLPVHVPADPSEYRLDTINCCYTIPVPKLHLLISTRKLPWLPEGHN